MSELRTRLDSLQSRIEEAISSVQGEVESTDEEIKSVPKAITEPLRGFPASVQTGKDDVGSEVESLLEELGELVR